MNNLQTIPLLPEPGVGAAARGRKRAAVVGVAIIVLYALALFIPLFGTPGSPQDEGILLVYPERMLHGAMPYRDFEYLYGPGALVPLVGVFASVGPGIIAERAVGLVYRLAIVLAVYLLIRRWGERPAQAGGVLACICLSFTILAAFAWLGGVALVLWSLVAYFRQRIRVAGLLAGLALTFRPDLIVAITLVALVLLIGSTRRHGRAYAQGVAIGLAPYLVVVALVGPTQLFDVLVRTQSRIVPGRHLPLGNLAELLLLLVLSAGTLVMLGVHHRDRHLLALGALSVGLLPQAFHRTDSIHWAYVACVVLALLPVAFMHLPPRTGRPVAHVGAVLVMLLAVLGLAVSWYRVPAPVVSMNGRWFPLDETQIQMTQEVLDAINRHAKPGDRLFVGTDDLSRTYMTDTFLYYLLPELQPASFYLEFHPGSANRAGTRLADDVASADYLILTNWYDPPQGNLDRDREWLLQEPEQAWQAGDARAQQVVADRFCTVAEHGMYRLLERCR